MICVFVFAYAKCWFSHDAAHMKIVLKLSSNSHCIFRFQEMDPKDSDPISNMWTSRLTDELGTLDYVRVSLVV